MGVDGIGEVGDWASEGQAAGVYGTGFGKSFTFLSLILCYLYFGTFLST